MKLAIIGAAGVRTPLLLRSIIAHQERLNIHELSLMDIDGKRLDLISALIPEGEQKRRIKFLITHTTDPISALKNADYVITTFRVGGYESRAIDERVPLSYGALGQETTGAGGFAMGIRSIPVILNYVKMMQEVCRDAWLINFANPAGMLTEAVVRNSDWKRVVGICDGPSSMHREISRLLNAKPEDVMIEYFGLNHLGWIRSIIYQKHDFLPDLLNRILEADHIPGLPFDASFVANLGMIPNEYLYYYYYADQAVNNIIKAGECRGEQIARLNTQLFDNLSKKYHANDYQGMKSVYQAYLNTRSETYMATETGMSHQSQIQNSVSNAADIDEGYAGVALNLIEALSGNTSLTQVLNIPNQGSINCMGDKDIVEIPCRIMENKIQPLLIGDIPEHCQGLMKEIKNFEYLTIEAALNGSYVKALLALTLHPLIRDFSLAKSILDEYISHHGDYFPKLH